ncbi:rhodanese-like domain-containing protein [Saccharophagus degradans]|uniref:Rhodanese-like domain-containing protein n=1 Tax=Saccharophagus degradans TaxID=86304 RepID=A0AAW7X361_9GAMM|nr:rhodanese-like domain-containing protein [Saccharophagus degradans]MDO6421267.1 rhodanese-like domain-containing protein [Saccharophagus degradans]MDO6605822.1 rhodanese-like domain-containing protein [Saccharophagus degradans]
MSTVYWIDVREADEYASGHHPQAVNIPYESIDARIGEVTEDKNADIRVYCRTGRRSGIAKDTLDALGFTKVTNEGGIEDVLK